MESTDKSLVDAHCKGDPEAFGELVHRYGGSVLGFLTAMTGNRDQAEDFFQETFKRVHEKAQTRLIVGQVHLLDKIAALAKREHPYGSPVFRRRGLGRGGYGGSRGRTAGDASSFVDAYCDHLAIEQGWKELRPKEIKKEGLSEYFLYTIEGTESIPDKWGKRLISFDVSDIEVESLYKYDEERWGGQAIRFLKFSNDEDHNLGQTPIPNGAVKIYAQADEQGYLSYVGRTNVKYIPVDEEVELNLGSARQVVIEPILMDFKTDNYVFDRKGNVAGWDEIRSWEIELTNTRLVPVEIEITRGFGTAYWTVNVQGEGAYEKHDAEHIRFKTKLGQRTKRKIKYEVRTFHGLRQESLPQQQQSLKKETEL